MLIGPYSFFRLKETIKQAYTKKNKKEHFQDGDDKIIHPKDVNSDITTAGVELATVTIIIFILAIALWVWNLILVIKFWNRIPVITQVFAVLGLISGGLFCPLSIILIYTTKGKMSNNETIIYQNAPTYQQNE